MRSVAVYECRAKSLPVFLGERDAGCDGDRDATELRLVLPVDGGLDQLWVEEYLVPECLAHDRDWLLGKDLLELSPSGVRALRSITY